MIYVYSFGVVPLKQEAGVWKLLLVLHKEGGHWSLPKGKRSGLETPMESAARELFEETGLAIVSWLAEVPFREQYQFRRRGQLISKEVSYFPAVVSGELRLQQEEIQDAKWSSFPEALASLSFKETRDIVQATMKIVGVHV